MQQQGREGVAEQVSGVMLDVRLRQKLTEEAHEIVGATDRESLIEELADVQEVIIALAKHHKISVTDIEARRQKKLSDKGGFERGHLYTYDNETTS